MTDDVRAERAASRTNVHYAEARVSLAQSRERAAKFAAVEAVTTGPKPSPPQAPGPGRGHVKAVGDVQPLLPARGTTNTYLANRIARDAPEVHERMKGPALAALPGAG